MSYNWSLVTRLTTPIQTTSNDVIVSGHGAVELGAGFTTVPSNVEFHVIGPPASSISDTLGQALENRTSISYLGIANPGDKNLIPVVPSVYTSGSKVPNYVLYAPHGLKLDPKGPHILGVMGKTELSTIWPRLTPFIKGGSTVRVFWAACSSVKGAKNQMVVFK